MNGWAKRVLLPCVYLTFARNSLLSSSRRPKKCTVLQEATSATRISVSILRPFSSSCVLLIPFHSISFVFSSDNMDLNVRRIRNYHLIVNGKSFCPALWTKEIKKIIRIWRTHCISNPRSFLIPLFISPLFSLFYIFISLINSFNYYSCPSQVFSVSLNCHSLSYS
jgi:hypothetical protein